MAQHADQLEAALTFFKAHMLGPRDGKARVYRQAGIVGVPTTTRADWQALAALLTGDIGERASCLMELPHHHVRTAYVRGCATYTFVQEAVEDEYEDFRARYHLVFLHELDLSWVEVWRFSGAKWTEHTEECGGIEFFAFSRFTDPEIGFSSDWIREHADPLLILEDGAVVYLDPMLWDYEN